MHMLPPTHIKPANHIFLSVANATSHGHMHLGESAICPLLLVWAHRCWWFASVTVNDSKKNYAIPYTQRADTFLLHQNNIFNKCQFAKQKLILPNLFNCITILRIFLLLLHYKLSIYSIIRKWCFQITERFAHLLLPAVGQEMFKLLT